MEKQKIINIWENSEMDLEQLLLEKKYKEASRYAEENLNLLMNLWKNEEYLELEKSVSFGDFVMSYFSSGIKNGTKQKALFDLGKLYNAVKIYSSLLFNLGIERRVEQEYQQELSGIKHFARIIKALEIHGSMTHTELSEYLGMKYSTLSEAMKKVLNTGTIQVVSSGKYKLYSLTDKGICLGKQLRKKTDKKDVLNIIAELQSIVETLNLEEQKEICNELVDRFKIQSIINHNNSDQLAIIETKLYTEYFKNEKAHVRKREQDSLDYVDVNNCNNDNNSINTFVKRLVQATAFA